MRLSTFGLGVGVAAGAALGFFPADRSVTAAPVTPGGGASKSDGGDFSKPSEVSTVPYVAFTTRTPS